MTDMDTLFDLDALDTKPAPPPRVKASGGRFYIYTVHEGRRYFLWKTHTNGEPEWVSQDECGRKRPLWFANIHTARQAVNRYSASGFDVWGGAL